MVLAQSRGAALIKGFADIKQKFGIYVKSRGAALIRGAASNTGFTVGTMTHRLFFCMLLKDKKATASCHTPNRVYTK